MLDERKLITIKAEHSASSATIIVSWYSQSQDRALDLDQDAATDPFDRFLLPHEELQSKQRSPTKKQPILPSREAAETHACSESVSEREQEHGTKPSKLHLKSENNRKLHLYNQVRLHIIN